MLWAQSTTEDDIRATQEVGDDKRLVELELACTAHGVAPPPPVSSGHCCHCRGNPDADYCWAGAIGAQDCSQVLETRQVLYLLAVHANIYTYVVRAVGYELALSCADFHSIGPCSVIEWHAEEWQQGISCKLHKRELLRFCYQSQTKQLMIIFSEYWKTNVREVWQAKLWQYEVLQQISRQSSQLKYAQHSLPLQ